MKIIIEIDTANAAFDVDPMAEAIAILSDAAEKLEDMPAGTTHILYDTNGNRCGFVKVTPADHGSHHGSHHGGC